MKIHEQFKGYFTSHKDDIIADLSRMIAVPSVLSAAEDNAPNGANCKKMLELAVSMFRESGFDAKISDDNLYALVRYGNAEKTIGLFAHGDVVPVDDKWQITSPFEAKLVDGRLFGRGAVDNKNAITFGLWFMRGLRELGIEMKNSLCLFIGSNEEAGMNDIEAFAENEKMPELCIVPDNGYPVSMGEKGRTALYCRADNSFSDILDIYGGDAENIVLGEVTAIVKYSDELYAALVSKADERYTIEKNGDKIKIVARGLASHAAHPENGINATGLLCELLSSCEELSFGDREVLSAAAKLLDGKHGESFNSFCEDGSFGKSTCANGIVSTPDGHLTLSFDIRYGTKMTSPLLRENAEKVLSSIGWHISSFKGSESFEIPRDNKLAQAILRSYREISGDAQADMYYSGGGTYAKHLQNAFSIGMSYNCRHKYDKLPAGHGSEHQPDESIHIDGFIDAMSVNAGIILDCDEIL